MTTPSRPAATADFTRSNGSVTESGECRRVCMCRSNFITPPRECGYLIRSGQRVREVNMSREHALAIWRAAVDAVRPEPLVEAAVRSDETIRSAARVLVVGAGKAGPGM